MKTFFILARYGKGIATLKLRLSQHLIFFQVFAHVPDIGNVRNESGLMTEVI